MPALSFGGCEVKFHAKRRRAELALFRFVWNPTFTMTVGSGARWVCGQVVCRPVHMSTVPVLSEEVSDERRG